MDKYELLSLEELLDVVAKQLQNKFNMSLKDYFQMLFLTDTVAIKKSFGTKELLCISHKQELCIDSEKLFTVTQIVDRVAVRKYLLLCVQLLTKATCQAHLFSLCANTVVPATRTNVGNYLSTYKNTIKNVNGYYHYYGTLADNSTVYFETTSKEIVPPNSPVYPLYISKNVWANVNKYVYSENYAYTAIERYPTEGILHNTQYSLCADDYMCLATEYIRNNM